MFITIGKYRFNSFAVENDTVSVILQRLTGFREPRRVKNDLKKNLNLQNI